MHIYTVKPGDSLSSIAAEFGTSASLIINTNFPPYPDMLAVGQDFVIISPTQVYTAAVGDTVFSVSQKFGISQSQLLRSNPSLAGRNLYPDETIVISTSDNPENTILTNGYAYTNINERLLRLTLPYLTYVTIFTYGFTPDGSLIYPNDEKILSITAEYDAKPLMHISTLTESGNFSSALAADLLNSTAAKANLIENIVRTVSEKGYSGADVDFEFLPAEDTNNYIQFVSELSQALNNMGLVCLVALAPKTSANQPGLLYESHDYAGLGAAADFSLLMTYEWGYTYSMPMAVAPLPNVESVLRFGVTQIAPQKILLGMPPYGYDWQLPYVKGRAAQSLSPQRALEIASVHNAEIQYDGTSQSPFFYYTESGHEHTVWFEDAKSADAKYNLTEKYNLAGVGYWNIDRFFPQNLLLLNSRFKILKV